MSGRCCVGGCEPAPDSVYFEFPTSGVLRRKWLDVIPIPKGKLLLGTVVCSQHFHKEDYEYCRGKYRLKGKVVPSLHLEAQEREIETAKKGYPRRKTKRKASKTTNNEDSNSDDQPLKEQEIIVNDTSSKGDPKKKDDPKENDDLTAKSDVLTAKCDDSNTKNDDSNVKSDNPIPESDDSSTKNDVPTAKSVDPTVKSDVSTAQKDDSAQKQVSSDKSVIATDPNVNKENSKHSNLASTTYPDPKQDIEDMIVNYQIKNKFPNPALVPDTDVISPPPVIDTQTAPDVVDLYNVKEQPPVFIEIAVDGDKTSNSGGEGSQDCLMVLESVQVEVDPSTMMFHPDFEPEEEKTEEKNENPISLLTSSDEDDVILQEPEIDTVEVSDETDEDDMPLVKLVQPSSPNKKNKPQKTPNKKKKLKKRNLKKSMSQEKNINAWAWGVQDYYCMKCNFSTNDSSEYRQHCNEHSTILQVCPVCGYTSASKTMFARHSRKHKEEKKYKCHLCDYRAKHNMSLIYHLQSHNGSKSKVRDKNGYHCKKCGFYSDVKGAMLRHVRVCESVVYSCDICDYVTKRRSDLKRHVARRHAGNMEDDDWVPSVEVD